MDTNPYASPMHANAARTSGKWRVSKAGVIGGGVTAGLHLCLHALYVFAALTVAYTEEETPGFDRFSALIGFPLPSLTFLLTGSYDLAAIMAIPNIILWAVAGGFVVQWIANAMGNRKADT